jgi:ATP adenylyltransferase
MSRQNFWAPWRISYLKDVTAEPGDAAAAGSSHGAGADADPAPCFLCEAGEAELSETERIERLMLLRDERGTMLLNRYPYTNGHLLVAPREHAADLSDLSGDRQAGLMELIDLANRLLQTALNPQGVNLGLNVGRCAGAGLPGHVHFHIVPRWYGDANFMDTVGSVRVIPQALEQSYCVLSEALAQINSVRR